MKILFLPLFLFSLPYEGAVRTRVLFYTHGLKKPGRLSCPVISVGNITVGGTGKTPLVMLLAKGLKQRGIDIAILSRGYKKNQTLHALVSDGQNVLLSPEAAGDEPFLMATRLKGVPILVGKDRLANGKVVIQRFGVRGLLLDDGYQHLKLYRDLNIVLVDNTTGFGDSHLLPRGILREPLSHLRRADLFVLTKMEEINAHPPLETKLQQIHSEAPVFHSRYEPVDLVDLEGRSEDLEALRGKKVLAFSGIANPEYFSFLLKRCGMEIGKEVIFPDHHSYTEADLPSLAASSNGMDRAVTTEKDMLKLKNLNVGHLPIRALRVEMKVLEEEEFFERIMRLFPVIEERRG